MFYEVVLKVLVLYNQYILFIVAAWKLSRTRTMINQSNSEINAYMNSREELHQPYFERVEQNDDCEEPNSSYLARSSIILILVCSVLRFLY